MIEYHVPDTLKQFCGVSRPIMRKWMPPNSCIGATRLASICLSGLGFKIRPVAVKFAVQIPALNVAYTSGFSKEELPADAVHRGSLGDNWNGHLVALVNDEWLLDCSFDQADAALGGKLKLDPICYVFPMTGHTPGSGFEIDMKADINDRVVRIWYCTTGDVSWRSSPAWNDFGLFFLAGQVRAKMNHERKGKQ